ncbi:hypothetical protein [Lutimonas sp.]|uniref:hypothetical protein n=1 Tax=Lutimonas sp. TaxID=1872403 RepID=UPI003D9ABC48
MTGGAGNIRDAQNRLNANRSMRASKKGKFKSHSHDLIYKTGSTGKSSQKKFTKEQQEKAKEKVRLKLQKEKKIRLIMIIIFSIITLAAFIYLNSK